MELRGKDFLLGSASKDETLGIMPRPLDASSDSSPCLFSNAIWNSIHLCCANKTFVCPGFPRSSAGKKSACNAEDPSSIPGLGRSLGEGTFLSIKVFSNESVLCIRWPSVRVSASASVPPMNIQESIQFKNQFRMD